MLSQAVGWRRRVSGATGAQGGTNPPAVLQHLQISVSPRREHHPNISTFRCLRQGPASTRYSTRTQNLLSYSNSTRTKHYSNRVVSSINSRNFRIISTIIQKQPARRYFRIITANPDIQMQPSMEKMSSDLNVKKMEDVSKLYKLYFKNYMTHKFISSCPCSSATSGLSGR